MKTPKKPHRKSDCLDVEKRTIILINHTGAAAISESKKKKNPQKIQWLDPENRTIILNNIDEVDWRC